MNYNERVWEQNILEKYRIKDGVSVLDIINLYLNRCREAKEVYDKEVRIYRPFKVRLCEIINNSMKEYFDGKVDISNVYEKVACFDLEDDIKRTSLDFSRGFDEYNNFFVVDLENIWKKDNKKSGTFLPCVFIDKDFTVYIPNKAIDNFKSFYEEVVDSAIDEKVCDYLKKSILNKKQELVTFRNIENKYKSSKYEDRLNERKEELLKALEGISVKLDNDITLKFSINERDFLESRFEREKVKIEAYDKNNKFLWSNDNGFSLLDTDSNSIIKNYKKILEFVSDSSCVWKLRTPFNATKQIVSNKKVRDAIDREREIDLAIANALKEKREAENRLKELKADNGYYLEMYKNTNKEIEELTGKVNSNHIDGMTEDMLFEKDDKGVLHVKDKYRDKLNLFDLSLIKWDNVDVRGLNFTGCNVNIDPQKVNNKDFSNFIFVSEKEDGSDFIFSEFAELSKVNFSGAVIKCKNNILNILDSIMDDNTVIEARNIVKEKKEHVYKIRDYDKEKIEMIDNYKNNSYMEDTNKRSKQAALDSLAKDIINGILTDEDIYALLGNKREDNLNKKL